MSEKKKVKKGVAGPIIVSRASQIPPIQNTHARGYIRLARETRAKNGKFKRAKRVPLGRLSDPLALYRGSCTTKHYRKPTYSGGAMNANSTHHKSLCSLSGRPENSRVSLESLSGRPEISRVNRRTQVDLET